MNKTFVDVVKDIENNLVGRVLKSISGNATEFKVSGVDYRDEKIVLLVGNERKTWAFGNLEKVWKDMYFRPATNVDSCLQGSGSSRNQIETIFASLSYVEWLRVDGKKCISYVVEDSHEYGTLKQMDEEKQEKYRELMKKPNAQNPLTCNVDDHVITSITGYQSLFERNRIIFGAPGTGKSYTLNKEKDELLTNGGEYERVTFHPDYSYAHFVGTYKPVPKLDDKGQETISYEFVPGPFLRTYVKALENSRTENIKPYLLIVEEINRANVAAVFGDVFQLLDRNFDNVSEYPIQASEDIRNYLVKELGGESCDYSEICIPDNMFIWATMNSADQGVFPMDTAFKRRWDFTYIGIDDGEKEIKGKKVILGKGTHCRNIEWNKFRKAINNELLSYKVNEDKLLGPFFISKKFLDENEQIDSREFSRIFKNKVIMYLFDDAAKQKRPKLFEGCSENSRNQYSKICDEFDIKGVDIFTENIRKLFVDDKIEDDIG